jgi:hypothetical protein
MRSLFLAITLFILLVPARTLAWGSEGHHIVAEIAARYLSETARENLLKYLGGTSYEQASVWMDEMRSNRDYDFMKPWHYINITRGTDYSPSTEENVINEIIASQRELGHYKTVCAEQVKTDVMVLFHLIGDLHQPLHAGYGEDHGGNTIEINFLGEATNLHWVWDAKIIEQQKITLESCLELLRGYSQEQIQSITGTDVLAWMNESRSYLGNVYDYTGHVLGEEYAKKNRGIVEKQLIKAGLRLAAVMEKVFGKIPVSSGSTLAAGTDSSGKPLSPEEAAKHIGETRTVCGKIFGGKYLENSKGSPTLINMGAAYPASPFTVVIFGSDRVHFTYKPEEFLDGKTICVTGLIKLYKDKPEIIVTSPSQISVK